MHKPFYDSRWVISGAGSEVKGLTIDYWREGPRIAENPNGSEAFPGFRNIVWRYFLNYNILIVNKFYSQCIHSAMQFKKCITRKILKYIRNSKLSHSYYCFMKRNKNYEAVLILCFILQMNEDFLS